MVLLLLVLDRRVRANGINIYHNNNLYHGLNLRDEFRGCVFEFSGFERDVEPSDSGCSDEIEFVAK